MIMLLRHLLAIALLPFTVTVLVPVWIARRAGVSWPDSAGEYALAVLGVAVLIPGFLLFAASLRRFATEGKGTLAPWDPPRRLVVHGPYRYVRNPMISGVNFIVCGEALLLRSWGIAIWAGVFILANVTWIPWYEEPHLEELFGEEYREYKRHVRRFVPRATPWTGES
jgi:protein-S-isoprenylcysteine O-methyltransferase Ste14